jgi:hypothetical protein
METETNEEEVKEPEVTEEDVNLEEFDENGEPIKKVIEGEPWMETEEETNDQTLEDPSKSVPVGKLVSIKKKLRGQISEKDDLIEKLKLENERLKTTSETPLKQDTKLTRPKEEDFETDEAYLNALDKYTEDKVQAAYEKNMQKTEQLKIQEKEELKRMQEVDRHYEAAAKLIDAANISSEIYQNADKTVRKAVEDIAPKQGDYIVEQLISFLGDGSEKVLYYLGRNKTALSKFQNLLVEDPSGMKAGVFLGGEKQRLMSPKKLKSNAPDPAPELVGDEKLSMKGSVLAKKYKAAHKKGNVQEAFNYKKNAKAAGVDVSKW